MSIASNHPVINFINQPKLFNEIINNQGEILIFDFRSAEDFKENHYKKYSINLPYNNKNITFDFCNNYQTCEWAHFSPENKKVLNRIKRFYILVVSTNEYISKDYLINIYLKVHRQESLNECELACFKALLFYNMLVKNKIRELGFYINSYDKFLKDFNFITLFNKVDKYSFNDPYPSNILDYRLFVGDQSHVSNIDLLKHFKITHILNATQHFSNKFENHGIKYLKIPIEDTENYEISGYFPKIFRFIDDALFGENVCPKYYDDSNDNHAKFIKRKSTLNFSKENYSNHFMAEEFEHDITVNEKYKESIFNINSTLNKEETIQKEIEFLEQKVLENPYSMSFKNELFQLKFKLKCITNENLNRNRVLVHCSLGVSRSSCAILCYIMKKFKLSYIDASELLRYQRNKATPIQGFINELEAYEKRDYEIDV